MKLKRLCLTGIIIVICAIIITLQAASSAVQEASISVEPTYTEVWQGENFTVNITVDSAETGVYGASYTLYFNNTLLNATSLEKGPFLSQDGNPSNVQYPPTKIDNAVGEIKYGECKIGTVPGVTGYGVLTTITFQVIGEEGISPLNLGDLDGETLFGISGSIPTTLNNGRVGVAQATPPFLISGYVSYENESVCNDPTVNITNLNIGEEWTADKDASSNYYQLMRSSCADVIVGDVLRFDAASSDGSQNTTEHTVTQDEVNGGGIFNFNITLTAESDTTPPIITNVANGTPTDSSVTITWTTDEASDSLVKYGIISGTYTDSEPNTTMVTSHSITLTGLSPDTIYYFVVNSTDASDNSNESAEHSFTTPSIADTNPPVITNVANTTPTTGSVTITWTTDEASDSLVKYGTTSSPYTGSEPNTTMVTSHSITLTGLSPDTIYYFVVNSTDASDNSNESAEHSFTTPSIADTNPPVITNVANGTPTTDSVTITWTTDEASDSLVKYGTTSGTYTGSEPNTTMVTSHSITLTGLSADTTYYFVVNSTDASDNSNESAEHSFTTPSIADTNPPVITNVANTTPTTDSVTITWTTDEASDSLVKYGTTSGVYTDDLSDMAMTTLHSIDLSGLSADTIYYFVVNSTDASDNSNESAEHSFTTPSIADTNPPVITNVANTTPTDSSVTITWTTDEASDSLVKYGTTSGTYTDREPNTTMVTSHSITLTGLSPDTIYYFVVNSTDASDNSNESAEHSFTTPSIADTNPPVITNVANTTPTTDSVTITWTTDEASDSLVKYGTTSGTYTDSEPNTTMVTSHSITLTGLSPDTPYYFVVNSTDASGNSNESEEHSFTTAAESITSPELVSCVITPTPPVVQGTNISVDCLFSEGVDYEIRIENATGALIEMIGSGTEKDPDPKWWNTTTGTPAETYIVNVTMNDGVNPMVYNNTSTIRVTGPEVEVDIGCGTIYPYPYPGCSVTLPITLRGITDYGAGTINLYYNASVVEVSNVTGSEDSSVEWNVVTPGWLMISALNAAGASGDVVFANVVFNSVGNIGECSDLNLTVDTLGGIHYKELPYFTTNCSICIEDPAPIVSNPSANPDTILNDNGRARVPGTNVSVLTVTVTDENGIAGVTINLSSIWGPGNDSVPMTPMEGTDQWTVEVNAPYDAGVNQTHNLEVNATNLFGNSNTTRTIELTVLRRGDIVRDNEVNMFDYLYIARYTVGLEPAPDELVAGIISADSHNGVNMLDALYIARYTAHLEPAP